MSKKIPYIVTSYQRPKYLEQCLASLQKFKEWIEIIVVDGGSDKYTIEIIRDMADESILLRNNPGADVLKNEGIARVQTPYFLIGSDDYTFPDGWFHTVRLQYQILNAAGLKFVMMATPTELVIQRHTFEPGQGPSKRGVGYHYSVEPKSGLEIMTTSVAMVAGTVMDTEATRAVGCFPVYGKTGQGDIAISKRFRKLGYEVGYFKDPVLVHLGQDKDVDYPEYSADFEADDSIYQQIARDEKWVVPVGTKRCTVY